MLRDTLGPVRARPYRFSCLLKGEPDLSFIVPGLYVGGSSKIERLAKIGIQVVADLRMEESVKEEATQYDMEYLKFNVPNDDAMAVEKLDELVRWIRARVYKGRKVLVHCALGRSQGTFV